MITLNRGRVLRTQLDVEERAVRELEHAYYDPKRVELQHLLKICNFEGKKTLEIGCGIGTLTLDLAKITRKSIGIDNDPAIIKIASDKARQENRRNAQFLVMDAEHLLYEDVVFDGVLCVWTFNSLDHPLRVLKECKRVLKRKGKFILLDAAEGSFHYEVGHLLFPNLIRPIRQSQYRIPLKRTFGRIEREVGPFDVPYIVPTIGKATELVTRELARWYTPPLSADQKNRVEALLRAHLNKDGSVTINETVKIYVCSSQ